MSCKKTKPSKHSFFAAMSAGALLAAAGVPSIGRADIVVLNSGKIMVGRLATSSNESGATASKKSPSELQLVTARQIGSSELRGRQTIAIARADIRKIITGPDELVFLEGARNAADLVDWSASYFQANLSVLAARCIEKAIQSDASLKKAPKRTNENAEFNRFWNRTVFRLLGSKATRPAMEKLLDLARWAHDADLNDEAAHYLRRAWSSGLGNAVIVELARKWNVRLEPWVQLDLTPALDSALFSTEIRDEGQRVVAAPDHVFLTLPLRYEAQSLFAAPAESADQTFSKSLLRGRDKKGLYGFRHVSVSEGRVRIDGLEGEPVYERMALIPGEAARRLVVLKNQVGPRPDPTGEPGKQKPARQPRVKSNALTDRASGWAAMIFEIPTDSSVLTIDWADGSTDTLNLSYLKQLRDAPPERIYAAWERNTADDDDGAARWSSIPEIVRTVDLIGGPSAAMAALGIERLYRIKHFLHGKLSHQDREEQLEAWSWAVDDNVLEAGRRPEDGVRLAAWRYFCGYPSDRPPSVVSPVTLDLLAQADSALQLQWVQLIRCGLRVDDCGSCWRESAGRIIAANEEPNFDYLTLLCNPQNASALLGAILQSEDSLVCLSALDALIQLGGSVVDWGFLEFASAVAQRHVLARLSEIADSQTASKIVLAVLLSSRPEMARDVAAAARAIDLKVPSADEAILAQWWSLHPEERKPAFLAMLEGINLGDSIYSYRFSEMLADARKTASLDPAIWRLAIRQLQFRADHGQDRTIDPADYLGEATMRRPFPMMLAHAEQDPLVRIVLEAGTKGPRSIRQQAIMALLDSGYAEVAAECLTQKSITPKERGAILKRLIDKQHENPDDAHLALLGTMLQPAHAAHAPFILNYLARVAASDDRGRWQVRLALKAGLNFRKFDALREELSEPEAYSVNRWLIQLGHMSPQDGQRLEAATTPENRAIRLSQISLRRGQLVDGEYGVVAVVSTSVGEDAANPTASPTEPGRSNRRWRTPRFVTVQMPPLTMESRDLENTYVVRWNQRVIGEGATSEELLPIRGPAAYFPRLVPAVDWPELSNTAPGGSTSGDKPAMGPPVLVGPPVLPSRPVLENPSPGTMTLEISDYLATALLRERVFDAEELVDLVPKKYEITLRYGLFGSFNGCGPKRDLPGTAEIPAAPEKEHPPEKMPRRHLVNVMLVLEKID